MPPNDDNLLLVECGQREINTMHGYEHNDMWGMFDNLIECMENTMSGDVLAVPQFRPLDPEKQREYVDELAAWLWNTNNTAITDYLMNARGDDFSLCEYVRALGFPMRIEYLKYIVFSSEMVFTMNQAFLDKLGIVGLTTVQQLTQKLSSRELNYMTVLENRKIIPRITYGTLETLIVDLNTVDGKVFRQILACNKFISQSYMKYQHVRHLRGIQANGRTNCTNELELANRDMSSALLNARALLVEQFESNRQLRGALNRSNQDIRILETNLKCQEYLLTLNQNTVTSANIASTQTTSAALPTKHALDKVNRMMTERPVDLSIVPVVNGGGGGGGGGGRVASASVNHRPTSVYNLRKRHEPVVLLQRLPKNRYPATVVVRENQPISPLPAIPMASAAQSPVCDDPIGPIRIKMEYTESGINLFYPPEATINQNGQNAASLVAGCANNETTIHSSAIVQPSAMDQLANSSNDGGGGGGGVIDGEINPVTTITTRKSFMFGGGGGGGNNDYQSRSRRSVLRAIELAKKYGKPKGPIGIRSYTLRRPIQIIESPTSEQCSRITMCAIYVHRVSNNFYAILQRSQYSRKDNNRNIVAIAYNVPRTLMRCFTNEVRNGILFHITSITKKGFNMNQRFENKISEAFQRVAFEMNDIFKLDTLGPSTKRRDYMGAPDSIVRLLACEQNIADLFYTLSPPRIYANLNKKFRPNKD